MPEPGPDDIEPVAHETLDRFATGTVSRRSLPGARRGRCWQVWARCCTGATSRSSRSSTSLTGLGVRSASTASSRTAFATSAGCAARLAVCGSAAIEGPVISWVADHRKHHAFSDQPATRTARTSTRRRLARRAARPAHAHVGWLFIHTQRGKPQRYAPDLHRRPGRRASSTARSSLGDRRPRCAVRPRLADRRDARRGAHRLLWGGAVRLLVLHHVTSRSTRCATSSGARRFDTGRRVAQPRVAVVCHVRRGVAQQPPRVPDLAAHGMRVASSTRRPA
jgi:stearoyl-CoA desaturase (delta-9 desaturase)